MNQLSTIQIRITGEVSKPGAYTVGGLSTMVDALLSTGGVKPSGSLRKIQLLRAGQVVSNLDLYDLLIRGETSSDKSLQHNDVIFVPPLGPTISVSGEVQRPAIFEIKNEKELMDAIELAGGLLPTASLNDSHIERIENRRYRTLVDFDSVENEATIKSTNIQSGDVVRILPVSDKMENIVLLSGHVVRPGGYQFEAKDRVSDLIADGRQILPNTDLDFALLIREENGTRRKLVNFLNLAKIIAQPGGADDLELRPRDELQILSLNPDREKSHTATVN